MQTIEETIEVEQPVSAVYDQWTRFQDFPQFMAGIKEVRLVDGKRLHWKAEIGGQTKGWDAEIVEQVPNQRITWRSTSTPIPTLPSSSPRPPSTMNIRR